MSLSSSLFTGTSGLKNMGNALQVVGNNISNLNTIGFKKGRATFADTLYENVATQSGVSQMGRGMAVGNVSQNFAQGSLESTGNTTDISIGGDGFFVVRQLNSENTFYTRAGNFFLDNKGQLVNPGGYIVQGWNLDDETGDNIGSITDLMLKDLTSPPKKSEEITAITNLDADSNSKAVILSNAWNSGETKYIDAGNYEYQTSIKVYDALGSTHDISIFYDKKSGTEWEYIITCNPEEDKRNLVQGTDSKGLLAKGTIQFSQSSGNILDLTMNKFTGRLGNFVSSGINAVDDVGYEIVNYEAFAEDEYGFGFKFNGSSWEFADLNNDGIVNSDDLPTNYDKAKIVYSDSQRLHLTLNPDDSADPDLKIQFAKPAVNLDTIGFDINDKNDLHIQGIEGTIYTGGATVKNTEMQINNPGVMTVDSADLCIVWNPNAGTSNEGKWNWSNPVDANAAGTLVSELTSTFTSSTTTITSTVDNDEDITMVSRGIKLRYDTNSSEWDWNMPLKTADFANKTFSFDTANVPDPVLSVTPGSEGAIASLSSSSGDDDPIVLSFSWDETDPASPIAKWEIDGGGAATNSITTGNSNEYVKFKIGTTECRYDFESALTCACEIKFSIDPTPPEEYPNAVLITGVDSDTAGHTVEVDFEGNSTPDLTFDINAAAVADDVFSFDTRPDTPPKEYLDATLKGDQTKAVIDLDGSGNEGDDNDIVFSFPETQLRYGKLTHPYNDRSTISFDILGSTAWTEISKDEMKQTGYFEFTTDFLGGEYGATETDVKFNIGSRYDGISFINDSSSTTQFSKSSSTIFQDANGYAAGDYQGVDVSSDGILTGIYSNGQLIPLFRIGLAKFINNFGLATEGGNLFRETRDSGRAITNKPGENGLGTLVPNSLEMSNVDISEEFVAMIVNQRGFQANSKTVTTVDDMMQTVIQMKR